MRNIRFLWLTLICVMIFCACSPAPREPVTQAPPGKTVVPPTFTATPFPPEIMDAKGVPMRLVPAGKFSMGSNEEQDQATPVHEVYLNDFYMDKYEVTNALYKACADAGICAPLLNAPYKACSDAGACDPAEQKKPTYYGNPEFDQYPVIYVSWEQADTFCKWRGARLPTEAEWEKAARGTDGRIYPWGEGLSCDFANYGHCVGDTTPIGSYEKGKSPYGIFDMTGNVWEWTADWYSESYYQNSPTENPLGPESGDTRVLRGGAWDNDFGLRSTTRSSSPSQSGSLDVIGFRCARDAHP